MALDLPQGYFVLFVGRRYYLRPNPLRSVLHPPLRTLWNARSAIGTRKALLEQPPALERPPGLWNGLRLLERPQGVRKNHYYTRATHGIVEVMWSNRGAFVERGFRFGVP